MSETARGCGHSACDPKYGCSRVSSMTSDSWPECPHCGTKAPPEVSVCATCAKPRFAASTSTVPEAEEEVARLAKILTRKIPSLAPDELEIQVYTYLAMAWMRGAQAQEKKK